MTDADDPTLWHEHCSQGELRRIHQHMQEARQRLTKAYTILDDAGAIEDWDGDYGDMYTFTSAVSYTADFAPVAERRYTDRRQEDADD